MKKVLDMFFGIGIIGMYLMKYNIYILDNNYKKQDNMLRFKQYILEKWFYGIKSPDGMVDIYHNPDRKEMKNSTSRFNDTRAIVHNDNLITWNADTLLHHHVRHHTGINDGIDAIIDHSKKSIQLFGEPESTREKFKEYENTPHFKQHFKDYSIQL
jgi:hypothetical protein